MKYATRMILVPEADFLHQQSNKKHQNTRKAAIDVAQKLGKQIRHRNQSAARLKAQWNPMESQIGPTVQLSSLYKETKPMANALDVSEMMPTLYRNKTKLLLGQLMARGMKWNDLNELVLPDGQTIANSNILALLKEALVARQSTKKPVQKPIGWTEFIQGIAQVGIPYGIFKKRSTLDDLNQAKGWEDIP